MLSNLLITTDSYFRNKIINDFKTKYKDYDHIYIDLFYNDFFDLLEHLNTYQLFNSNKLIIVNNLFNKDINKKDEEEFLNYLKEPLDSNILLIVDEKLDKRKKFQKEVIKHSNVIESSYNLYDEIKNNLEDYSMKDMTINYFINYLNQDINLIINELEKLKIYKLREKEITIDDINLLVTKKLEDNIFELTNAIMDSNIKLASTIYNDLINNKEEVTKLILLVANQFSLLLDVKRLSNKSEKEISDILGVHPYRVKLAQRSSRGYDLERLEDIVIELSNMDYLIKSGKLIKDIAFEMFLAKL